MKFYRYSKEQLENEANKLNFEFDKQRLSKPKDVDVYDVVDFLGCTTDFLYLSPDQSILGMTSYNDGEYPVWFPLRELSKTDSIDDKFVVNGLHPKKVFIKRGTIVVDRGLNESGDRGRENFTCIHECFHQRLHLKCFRYCSGNFDSFSLRKNSRYLPGVSPRMTALEINEYQANYCAAAFLMPRMAVEFSLKNLMALKNLPNKPLPHTIEMDYVIREMAQKFSVNYSPMKYRLQDLNLLDRNDGVH